MDVSITSLGDGAHVQSIASIQNSSCPIFDLPSNVRFQGNFQTMKTQAMFSLEKAT